MVKQNRKITDEKSEERKIKKQKSQQVMLIKVRNTIDLYSAIRCFPSE